MRKQVKLKVQNGLSFEGALSEILSVVSDRFSFIESNEPDFILFGPYGNDIPKPGKYSRIGYFCENIIPDLDACEWAFGVPPEATVNSPKYKRIQWHNLDPANLLKKNWDGEQILAGKTKFCNFLYSNQVPYREEFFRQLSKYKKVDAPGKSMNNAPLVDSQFNEDKWKAKRRFLTPYKFTIAFENYVYPGYQTEKLYDAMLCQSIPVYCGDPNIGEIFNTNSFVYANDYIAPVNNGLIRFLEEKSQLNFVDIRPKYFKSPNDRLQRKLKAIGREMKMRMAFKNLDFSRLIDQIVLLDTKPEKYLQMLNTPWFYDNKVPVNGLLRERWIEIFSANTDAS